MQYERVCVAETDVRPLWQDVDVPLWSHLGTSWHCFTFWALLLYDIVTLIMKFITLFCHSFTQLLNTHHVQYTNSEIPYSK